MMTEDQRKIRKKESDKKYNKGHVEQIRLTKKKYYQKNIEYIHERFRKYRAKNSEKLNKQKREYYRMNIDKIRKYREKNKGRKNEYRRKNYNRVKVREDRLRFYWGISSTGYNEILSKQNGVCKICLKPETALLRGIIKNLAIDHNHGTGEIRGLLCTCCNRGLGLFKDNPELLKKATEYLESFKNKK